MTPRYQLMTLFEIRVVGKFRMHGTTHRPRRRRLSVTVECSPGFEDALREAMEEFANRHGGRVEAGHEEPQEWWFSWQRRTGKDADRMELSDVGTRLAIYLAHAIGF